MKDIIKKIVGRLKCNFNRITYVSGCYIGFNVKIVNKSRRLKIKKNVIIRPSSCLYTHKCNSYIELGNNVEVGNHSTISSLNSVIIKDGVLTGPHVFISDHNHEYHNPYIHIYKQGLMACEGSRVLIGEGTWLGTNVVVVGNVHIGKQCVIGANSVVTKDIPDYCVAIGIPAKVIKEYDFNKEQWIYKDKI